MVASICFLKPAWYGNHSAGLRPEIGLTARYSSHRLQAVLFTPEWIVLAAMSRFHNLTMARCLHVPAHRAIASWWPRRHNSRI
jgi:hypothetical protein